MSSRSGRRSAGLQALVAQLHHAELCAITGCATCRRDVDELRATLIGLRVQWVCASDLGGTVMTITHAEGGLVEVTGFSGRFAPHLLKEVSIERT